MNYKYLVLLIIATTITFLLQRFFKIRIYKTRKEMFYLNILFLAIMAPLDSWAISNHLWAFPEIHSLGINLGNIPVEDFIFTIAVTYSILVYYKIAELLTKKIS